MSSGIEKDHNTEIEISTKDVIDRCDIASDSVSTSEHVLRGWLSSESILGYGYRFQDL